MVTATSKLWCEALVAQQLRKWGSSRESSGRLWAWCRIQRAGFKGAQFNQLIRDKAETWLWIAACTVEKWLKSGETSYFFFLFDKAHSSLSRCWAWILVIHELSVGLGWRFLTVRILQVFEWGLQWGQRAVLFCSAQDESVTLLWVGFLSEILCYVTSCEEGFGFLLHDHQGEWHAYNCCLVWKWWL